jgi:DNA-binding Lrp family transcriptional regulator
VKNLATAFVLFNSETGQETQIIKELKKIKEVKEAHLIYGVYDIIAHIETDSMQELKEVVNWKLRRLEKVRSTLTMIAI